MTLIDDIRKDREPPQVKRLSGQEWSVVPGQSPGTLYVRGPSFTTMVITTASDLSGEDYIARNADARRIARVPDMEAALLAAEELAQAVGDWSMPRGSNGMTSPDEGHPLMAALAAYRKATT